MRFPVQDVYDVGGASVAVGRVEAGTLHKGQSVVVLPEGRAAKIAGIMKYLEDDMIEAPAGDCIGITVEGAPLKRGQIVADVANTTITDTIHANIFWMVDKDYKLGIPVTFKCATQEVRGKINRINKRFDPASVTIVENDAQVIKPAEIAEVEISLEGKVSVDRFSDIPELGRFVLEHGGHPVAGGIII
ncbi:MAG: hypothetical protein A3J24_00780 [Deltaproteobacteria bacterium RIFCSPLOWO2_02_FULL_53_8]|nr:MAG: hypothetical protein A3J24_00780 [Deltaproteobacteria bacterium RIFCSPLOWO2_02_FULL_53_8]